MTTMPERGVDSNNNTTDDHDEREDDDDSMRRAQNFTQTKIIGLDLLVIHNSFNFFVLSLHRMLSLIERCC